MGLYTGRVAVSPATYYAGGYDHAKRYLMRWLTDKKEKAYFKSNKLLEVARSMQTAEEVQSLATERRSKTRHLPGRPVSSTSTASYYIPFI